MTSTLTPLSSDASAAAWDSLRQVVSGRLVTPADADFLNVRTPWIVNVDQQPAAVLEVAHAGDVVEAVRWAAAHGTSVSAQPTGHAPRTTLDGTLLLRTRALQGIDSLLSIVQMPRGIPVATVAIGKSGAANAALLAAAILANKHPAIATALDQYRAAQTAHVLAQPDPRETPL